MVTPWNSSRGILLNSVDRLVEHLISSGVHGLFPLGSTGEMFLLSQQERMKMAERVIETNSGRLPVFVQVAAPTTNESVLLARHAHDAGADGIAAVTPAYYRVSDEEMYDYYSTIAQSVPKDFPVYLYNLPQSTTNDLSVSVCQQLAAKHPNIIGIKYSFSDMERTRAYLAVRDGNFSVLQGCDLLANIALVLGCDGVVSGLSNVFPEPFVELYNALIRLDAESVCSASAKIQNIGRILLDGCGMANMKAALRFRGIEMGDMVLPLHSVSDDKMQQLHKSLKVAGLIQE